MKRLVLASICGALSGMGCSASGTAAPGPGAGGAPAVGCTPGPQSCHCPDGARSGTQTCDDQGHLTPCVCPNAPVMPNLVRPGATDTPANVCADLRCGEACSATTYASQQVPASVLFVVDRSGSMACNTPDVQSVEDCNANPQPVDPGRPSRWRITVDALNAAFASISGSASGIGLSLFSTDGYCGVDATPEVGLAAPSAVQLSALADAMSAASPGGGTPIVGAVVSAYHHLHEQIHAPGNRYVVLITDGEESCGTKSDETDEADLAAARQLLLTTEVQKAREANIETFVIGAPGSEGARGFLSELAYLGGTARDPACQHGDDATGDCHYDLTRDADFAAVLGDALGKISGKALGCEFQTPPGATALLNVQYTQGGGEPVCFPQDTAPCEAGANGWQFARDAAGNDDTSRVVLCGAACDLVKSDPTMVVDVILGCRSIR